MNRRYTYNLMVYCEKNSVTNGITFKIYIKKNLHTKLYKNQKGKEWIEGVGEGEERVTKKKNFYCPSNEKLILAYIGRKLEIFKRIAE